RPGQLGPLRSAQQARGGKARLRLRRALQRPVRRGSGRDYEESYRPAPEWRRSTGLADCGRCRPRWGFGHRDRGLHSGLASTRLLLHGGEVALTLTWERDFKTPYAVLFSSLPSVCLLLCFSLGAEGDVELLFRSTSPRQDGEFHGVPDLVRTDGSDEPHASVNESIIDLAHHVPLLQPSLVRRASGVHLHDLSSDVAAGGVDLRADQRVD